MRDFLKQTLATLLGILIFLGLSLGGFLSLILMLAVRDPEPRVKDRTILVFDLSMDITDGRRTPASIGQALLDPDERQPSVTLRSVLDAIDAAAADSRIVGIYIHGEASDQGAAGFATLQEVRKALVRFRESGKKVIAYDTFWREREYYLGAVADEVLLNPIGSVEMNGLSSEAIFFADALKKLGIGVQVTRVGRYKSAVEPLLLNERSPANRQQTQTLLGDVWQEFLKSTGQSRQKTPQQLQAIADTKGILLAADAKQQGLVDRLAYEDEVIRQLKELSGSDESDKTFRQISVPAYAEEAADQLRNGSPRNTVAVVYAEGEIVDGQGTLRQVGGERFARLLRQLRQEERIKAVVIRINSPGGSVVGSDVIQREVTLTRQVKPVIISMGSVAASGGYWIATVGDRIFAEPTTITGSIGVFGVLPNVQQLANRNGVNWDVVKTGKLADAFTITRPKTPQEMALLQQRVDKIYSEFVTKVAKSRNLEQQKVAEIAQGRVWSGLRAKQLGLVDELGGLDAAIAYAAKQADLGDNWRLREYPRVWTLAERLLGQVDPEALRVAANDPLMREWTKIQEDLATLRALNDPLGLYARLPFNFRID